MVKLEEVFSDDEDGLESEEEFEEEVLLGFVEEPANADLLERHFFPSKVGGVPAWLDPVNLPSENMMVCGFCEKPLAFLMQVYGPLETEPSAFHRTLFVFVCTSNTCLRRHFRQQEEQDRKRSVRVFRCQLPRVNPFYSFHPAKPGTLPLAGKAASLCDWCGAWAANKRCGGCRDYTYCSKDHQVEHWKSGHVAACKRLDKQAPVSATARPTPAQDSVQAHAEAIGIAQIASPEKDKETFANIEGTSCESGLGAGSKSGRAIGDEGLGSENGVNSKEAIGERSGTSGGVDSSELRRGGEGEDAASVSASASGLGVTGAAGEKLVEGLGRNVEGLTGRVEGLSVDDAGFPVSAVDWESGSARVSGSVTGAEETVPAGSSTGGSPKNEDDVTGSGQANDGSRAGGSPRTEDDVTGRGQPKGDVRDRQSDASPMGSEMRDGTGLGTSSSETSEGARQNGLSANNAVKKDVLTKHGKSQTRDPVKGKPTEITAVVKPRALDPKLWPELELIVESELEYQGEAGVSGRVNDGLGDVSALMEQYGRRVEKNREFSAEDLEEAEAGMRDMTGDRKQWAEFEARLASAPEQVMRYCRSADAKPLWPSTSHRPSQLTVEPCPNCGSARIFEFQILPQLLYYMHVDSSNPETLDWGTIAVYTCSKSCKAEKAGYQEEAVWVQLPQ